MRPDVCGRGSRCYGQGARRCAGAGGQPHGAHSDQGHGPPAGCPRSRLPRGARARFAATRLIRERRPAGSLSHLVCGVDLLVLVDEVVLAADAVAAGRRMAGALAPWDLCTMAVGSPAASRLTSIRSGSRLIHLCLLSTYPCGVHSLQLKASVCSTRTYPEHSDHRTTAKRVADQSASEF